MNTVWLAAKRQVKLQVELNSYKLDKIQLVKRYRNTNYSLQIMNKRNQYYVAIMYNIQQSQYNKQLSKQQQQKQRQSTPPTPIQLLLVILGPSCEPVALHRAKLQLLHSVAPLPECREQLVCHSDQLDHMHHCQQ